MILPDGYDWRKAPDRTADAEPGMLYLVYQTHGAWRQLAPDERSAQRAAWQHRRQVRENELPDTLWFVWRRVLAGGNPALRAALLRNEGDERLCALMRVQEMVEQFAPPPLKRGPVRGD